MTELRTPTAELPHGSDPSRLPDGSAVPGIDGAAVARARERADYLARTALDISGSLDLGRTLHRGVRVCVPRLADWAQLLLVDGGRARLVCQRHDHARATDVSIAAPVASLSGQGRVLATGRSELLHVDGSMETPDGLTALVPDPAVRDQVNQLRPADVLAVALTARGTTFGTLTLARRTGRGFDADDVSLAEEVGVHLALALDAARRYNERVNVASVLQASLRPPELPAIDGLRLAARYRPGDDCADIGGDFYDVWRTRDGWSVVL